MSEPVTKRVFIYDGREFGDPDPGLSVDEVRKQMAEWFPELVNADHKEETRDGARRITLSRRIGTKGALGHEEVVAALRAVPPKRLRLLALAERAYADPAVWRQPDPHEFNLAVAEADAYAKQTKRTADALARLPAR